VKIISWNVNGIRSCARKGFLDFLQKEDPDILGIQESKAHPDDVDDSIKYPSGMKSYWSVANRKGYSGTVTFLKPAIQKHITLVTSEIGIKKFDDEGRFVIIHHKDFVLLNMYVPNGSQTQQRHLFKQDFLKRFYSLIKKWIQKGHEIIILGDYNTAYLDWDVFDPVLLKNASGFLPKERQWFQEFLSLGLIDCYRHFYPQQREAYTWWSYRENARQKNRGWRIDHICITPKLLKKVKSVDILSTQDGSDHCPIQIQLT